MKSNDPIPRPELKPEELTVDVDMTRMAIGVVSVTIAVAVAAVIVTAVVLGMSFAAGICG